MEAGIQTEASGSRFPEDSKTRGTRGTRAQVRPETKVGVRLRNVLRVKLGRVRLRGDAMVRSDERDWRQDTETKVDDILNQSISRKQRRVCGKKYPERRRDRNWALMKYEKPG